ncbi:two-component regulator propeller domain-containing protein [Bacteroides ovatus]|uniref:two-component regulator propeller domain-containing protein n=2 Tax=Bacteroides TaxID=816 RepID=UPI0032C0DAF2
MINIREVLLLILLLYGTTLSYSSDSHWCSEPMVIKNGLNNNTVYNLCHGKDGFIWLSTDRGISRYDGFRFRDYPLILKVDSLSIPLTQAVVFLKETSDGLFYAQLCQGGIVCFDKEKEKYLPFCFDRPFKLRDVLDFCWNDGVLYLATSRGLFRAEVVRKGGDKGEFISCTLGVEPLVKGKVTSLCAGGKTNLYVSVDRKKVLHYNTATKKVSLIKEYDVVNRLFLQNGYLWICRL